VSHVFDHLGRAPFRVEGFQELVYQACPGAPVQAAGSCDHCGTCIRWACIIQDADRKTFKVGTDCVLKTGAEGLIEAVKAAKKERRRAQAAVRRAALAEERAAVRREEERTHRQRTRARAAEFASALGLGFHTWMRARRRSRVFIDDVFRRLLALGQLSEGQVAAVKNGALPTAPCPTGRVEFVGRIESSKVQDGEWGSVRKMLVRAEEGFRVWCTVPVGLAEEIPWTNCPRTGLYIKKYRGLRIQLKVNLKTKNGDPTFGFGSRPYAKLIEESES
jgi:hypothetical protein